MYITAGKDDTSKIIEIMLRDSTTGAGKTGLVHGSVTAGYIKQGATRAAITLEAGDPGDSYSSGTWAEVDATNSRGVYQIHLPNAMFDTIGIVTLSLQASGTIDKAVVIDVTTLVNDVSEIKSSLSVPTNIYNNPSTPNRVELIHGPDGNAYDGTSHSRLSWNVGTGFAGQTFSFKVVYKEQRFADSPTLHLDTSGTVTAGGLAEPTILNADVDGLPTDGALWFWVTIESSATSHKTVAQGSLLIT